MATTVVLKNVVKAESGKVYVNFADGTQREFNSIAEAREYATSADLDVELTQRMCLARAFALSTNLTNIAQVKDKQFIFDLTNNNPIRLV